MKELLVSTIRKSLNGRLVLGTENWLVRDAVQITKYRKPKFSKSHTLIFVIHPNSIDWNKIEQVKPCAIITQKKINIDKISTSLKQLTIIEVANIDYELSKFAYYYRKMFQIPVVTITGTCGKTTVKEMLKWILKEDHKVHATIKNRNEQWRAFNYLVGIDDSTDVAVFEVSMAVQGAANRQYGVLRPTIGILTNIGFDHLMGYDRLEDYIREKAKIAEMLPNNGTLILNADDKMIQKIDLRRFKGKLIAFGVKHPCDFRATNIRYDKEGMRFTLIYKSKEYDAFVPGLGEHQVYNALAALAAAKGIGVSISQALKRLHSYRNVEKHLEVIEPKNGPIIIDDSWNTNPTSISAALKVFKEISGSRKKIVVLGDPCDEVQLGVNEGREIVDLSKAAFRKVGSQIVRMGIDVLVTIGPLTKELALQSIKEGMTGQVYMLSEASRALKILSDIESNSIVLLKGNGYDKSFSNLVDWFKSRTK